MSEDVSLDRIVRELAIHYARIMEDRALRLSTFYAPLLSAWKSAPATARKYSNFIGSPELLRLTKEPFLQLFGNGDISEEDLRVYSSWLTAIMIANQEGSGDHPQRRTERQRDRRDRRRSGGRSSEQSR